MGRGSRTRASAIGPMSSRLRLVDSPTDLQMQAFTGAELTTAERAELLRLPEDTVAQFYASRGKGIRTPPEIRMAVISLIIREHTPPPVVAAQMDLTTSAVQRWLQKGGYDLAAMDRERRRYWHARAELKVMQMHQDDPQMSIGRLAKEAAIPAARVQEILQTNNTSSQFAVVSKQESAQRTAEAAARLGSIAAICAELKISSRTVQEHLRLAGWSQPLEDWKPAGAHEQAKQERRDRIVRCARRRGSVADVCEELGLSSSVVKRELNLAGWDQPLRDWESSRFAKTMKYARIYNAAMTLGSVQAAADDLDIHPATVKKFLAPMRWQRPLPDWVPPVDETVTPADRERMKSRLSPVDETVTPADWERMRSRISPAPREQVAQGWAVGRGGRVSKPARPGTPAPRTRSIAQLADELGLKSDAALDILRRARQSGQEPLSTRPHPRS